MRTRSGKEKEIVLYTKPNCPLCLEVEELLEDIGERLGFSFSKVNILENSHIYEKYKDQIPVVEFGDGQSLFGKISRKELTQKIYAFIGERQKG